MNLDIRKTKFSRFADQKNTPDVVNFIADCILNHISGDSQKRFTIKDIWNTEYFKKNVEHVYSKPSPKKTSAQHEYDKFIGQPCRLLNYSQILHSQKLGNKNVYSCPQIKILEYIATNERKTFDFLYVYLNKVMMDSGFLPKLQAFKTNNTKEGFTQIKSDFRKFMRGNTPIRGNTEIDRIFPKILNIFAVKWGIKGSKKGRLSKQTFYFADLTYNIENWRDISKKEKRITRQEHDIENQSEKVEEANPYHVVRAKNVIKRIHKEMEIKDKWAIGKATHAHHIFPLHEYPKFGTWLENLIHLTPTQHFTKAHPDSKTSEINPEYQLDLLVAKSHSIENSLNIGEDYYDKIRFISMINECMHRNIPNDSSFDAIRVEIQR